MRSCKRLGILTRCRAHMHTGRQNPVSKNECIKDAARHQTRTIWSASGGRSRVLYETARQKGWLDECCRHLRSGAQTDRGAGRMPAGSQKASDPRSLEEGRLADQQRGLPQFGPRVEEALRRGHPGECGGNPRPGRGICGEPSANGRRKKEPTKRAYEGLGKVEARLVNR